MAAWTCAQCGAEFRRDGQGARRPRYCTHACYAASRVGQPAVRPAGWQVWNKGLKGIHLSPATEFRPGHTLKPREPLGTLRVRRARGGKRRRYIKTEQGWTEYAKWLWVEAHGHLIPGDVVHHLNGDALDDSIENLIALPRQHHPIYHSRWGLRVVPPDAQERYRERYA